MKAGGLSIAGKSVGEVRTTACVRQRLPFGESIWNRALRGDDAGAAMVLMAAVVFPLPQGAITRLNVSETKLDASSTFYRYRLFFILRVCPPF